jgi:hypothetical protein
MHSRFTFFVSESVLPSRSKPTAPRFRCRFTVLAIAGLIAGCGSAAGPDYAPVFVSLNGVITSSEIGVPPQVRVALIWKHKDPDGNLVRSAQELAVTSQFPVRFRLDITSLPPLEALNQRDLGGGQFDPNWRYATGTLVVYDDMDGNGILDLVRTDAETTADRILGAPEHLSVFYTEGSNVHAGGPGAQPGFNLRREPLLVDPAPGDPQCSARPQGAQQYLPLSTEIPVALTAAPELSREMCAVMDPTPPGCSPPSCQPLPVPAGAELTCSADGTAFVYKICPAPRGLCGSIACHYGCETRAPSDPIPAGWPCP